MVCGTWNYWGVGRQVTAVGGLGGWWASGVRLEEYFNLFGPAFASRIPDRFAGRVVPARKEVYHTDGPPPGGPSTGSNGVQRRGVWVIGGLTALVAGTVGWVWATWPPPPAPDWAAEYDTNPRPPDPGEAPADGETGYELTARPPEEIPAGTVIGRTAPPGWSHLVIKSLPRVRDDQQVAFPLIARARVVRMAAWMFTAFLADVRADQHEGRARYRFRAVALGLGTDVNGRDTILTPEAGRQVDPNLGSIEAEILGKGYEVQRKALLVVRGPTIGLLDTPVWFRRGDENRLLRYRYALLVDGPTGRLDVLVWRLGGGGREGGADEAVLLNPDTIDTAELVVDRRKVNLLGIPGDDAFAVDKMPHGRAVLPVPPDLRPLAARTRFTAPEVHALETRLRQLIAGSPGTP
ncbi:MAG: hypothetical protein JWO38_492 [Gemmataceae bacterium]|nr:hypothetical protein [Gemmataceae bacterium]